jgi:hypothetical protein
VVASGVVPEAATQTSFTPTSDLITAATYYWRVQASDTTTGVVSGYSTAQSFTTINPDDGLFRYYLTLQLVSSAQCIFELFGSPVPIPPIALPNTVFDDGLMVNGDRLTMGPLLGSGGVTIDLERSANQLSGILVGGLGWGGLAAEIGGFLDVPARVAGTADNATGRLTGNGSGILATHSGGLSVDICSVANFAFTLTPHP